MKGLKDGYNPVITYVTFVTSFIKVNCGLKGDFSPPSPVEIYPMGKYCFRLEQCKEETEEMSGDKEFFSN